MGWWRAPGLKSAYLLLDKTVHSVLSETALNGPCLWSRQEWQGMVESQVHNSCSADIYWVIPYWWSRQQMKWKRNLSWPFAVPPVPLPRTLYPVAMLHDSRLPHSCHSLDNWPPMELHSAQLLQPWVVALALLCPQWTHHAFSHLLAFVCVTPGTISLFS